MAAQDTIKQRELTSIIDDIVKSALKESGVTAVEAGGSLSSGLSTSVRMGSVETVEFNRDKSLGITVYKDKRKGNVSISDLSPNAIDSAIKAACRIAQYTEPDPYSGLADPKLLAKNIPDLDLFHPSDITAEQAISAAQECEAAGLAYDKRITNSDGASFSTSEQFYVYGNSDGFLASYPTSRYYANCVLIGQDASGKQRDYDYTSARDINDLLSLKQIGVQAAEKTLQRLGSRKLKTCKAPVLLTPKMAGALWGALISAISGGTLYRKSSFLLDHLHKIIFPNFVNIHEDPHLLKGLGSAPFDNEGVATTQKNIITSGILSTYLLSSYSARRLGMQTTGNSGGVHNVTVNPGEDNFDALVKKMGTGLIVTELMGQGTNIVTGDFSQGAAGLWVENGAVLYPVQEITIAGNFRDMFSSLVAIGNDVDHRSNIITGSVLLDQMMIAGG